MRCEWRSAPFEDLFAIPSRNGLTRPKRVRGEGVHFVNMGELFKFRRLGDVPMDRVPMNEKEKAKTLLQVGDLLFARQSLVYSGAGQCSIVKPAKEIRTFESHLIRCRLDSATACPDFYFYYFWSPQGRHLMGTIIEQVAAAGIRGSDLKRLPVPVPPLPEQRRIAAVLGALDDKIELNRKMNRTLEEMAQALFKSWFIDFDGHDDLVPSKLGPIPRGWSACQLGDLCTNDDAELRTGPFGTALNRREYTPTGVPVIAVRDLKSGYIELDDKTPRVPPEVAERLAVFRVRESDILFGRKGAVERSALIPRSQVGWVMGSDCIRLRLNPTLQPEVWACGFRTPAHTAWMIQHAEGSTMASLNQRILKLMPLVVPPCDVLNAAAAIIGPFMKRVEANRVESRTLAQLRDTLLPKLISGEIRVPEAEHAVEAAVSATHQPEACHG